MLTLLLGIDWVANRDEILKMLANDVHNQQGGRILIVPELISHDMERRLCAAAGDTCSRFAEVLPFSRLASRVISAAGHAAMPCMDNGGRVVTMASAVRQLYSKLKAYACVETRPDFLTSLVDAVDEFKRCCITAQDLKYASEQTQGSLAQKLEELSLILESYDALCERGKKDPRDLMTWVLEELEGCSFAQEHVFYIDGFPDFTRQHMAIISHLLKNACNVTVSLTCDRAGSKSLAFEKAGNTALELIEQAKKMDVPIKIVNVSPRNNLLLTGAQCLFQGSFEKGIMKSVFHTYQTDALYQECAAALEKVVELVCDGSRYRDICIVCGDMPAYRNTIEMLFERSNIPVYISGTEDILERSVISTVMSALDAALNGLEQRDVFRYLKSALSPIDVDTCDKIENYAIIWNVSGNKWTQPWLNHPYGIDKKWNENAKSRLEELNQIREAVITPLVHLRDGFTNADKLQQQIECLYTFLEEISLRDRLRRLAQQMDASGEKRNAQILNQLWDILIIALEQLYDALGQTFWDADNFTRLLRLLLSQYDVGTIPPVLDSVTIGPVSAMRCQQCKHLIVVGTKEGSFPGYSGSTGVLNDQERTMLRQIGIPLTGGAMEGLQAEFAEIYGVFCAAEASVTVSCAGAQPSFVYRRISDMAGGEEIAQCQLGPALRDPVEASAFLLRWDAQDQAKDLKIERYYQQVYERVNYDPGNITHENIVNLYGDRLNLSASQIDRQAECRLYYFLKYGIGAAERKKITIDPAEFGTYVHAVLENTARDIMSIGGFRQVSLDNALEIAQKHSREYAQERFAAISTQRINYLFDRNKNELSLIVKELWQEMQECEFTPVGFEVAFGEDGEIPPIDVSGTLMSAQLRGFVDRVDLWANGNTRYFRIVDYKTGIKDFDYCDILNGYGLQMLLYLFALEQNGQCVLGDGAIPAGVQYFPARAPVVRADGILTDEQALAERQKLWKRSGLLLRDDAVLTAMEDRQSPVRLSCSRKSDGSLVGDLADRHQLLLLKAYVFSLVGRMVDEIASGCVKPNPYTRGSSHNACSFCPYGSVCHSESVPDRRNYKTVAADDFWSQLETEVDMNG